MRTSKPLERREKKIMRAFGPMGATLFVGEFCLTFRGGSKLLQEGDPSGGRPSPLNMYDP